MSAANDPQQLVYAFRADLEAFGADVEAGGLAVFHEAAEQVADALINGNQYGPGAPVDTGFLRASFRVSKNQPDDGPSAPPDLPGRTAGDPPVFDTRISATRGVRLRFGDLLYVTTMAEYAIYLEEGGKLRRNGPPQLVGTPTPFVAPVVARWPAIVETAARQNGFGS